MIPAPHAERELRVLLLEGDANPTSFLAAGLRDRGHEVECANPLEESTDVRLFDVIVTDDGFGTHVDGAAVLDALGVHEAGIPAVVISSHRDFDRCRRAMRCGAADFLVRPFAPSALTHAVEAVAKDQRNTENPTAFVRHYFQGAEARERALFELGAHLMEGGLGPIHRIRIASAVAMILEHLHLRRGKAPVRIEAQRHGERVVVDVGAMGRMALSAVQPVLPFAEGEALATPATQHLERARALAEELELTSTPGHEEATLSFELTPVGFDEDEMDLSNADYVDPRSIDQLISVLQADTDDQTHMVPTPMATTVGRLLAILPRKRTAESSLRS